MARSGQGLKGKTCITRVGTLSFFFHDVLVLVVEWIGAFVFDDENEMEDERKKQGYLYSG